MLVCFSVPLQPVTVTLRALSALCVTSGEASVTAGLMSLADGVTSVHQERMALDHQAASVRLSILFHVGSVSLIKVYLINHL